jgi:excisionase family DNA binding protein
VPDISTYHGTLSTATTFLRKPAYRGAGTLRPWSSFWKEIALRKHRLGVDDKSPVLGLRLRQAARLLGVVPQTLARWASAGEIPARRVGRGKRRTWLFSISALERWLNQLPPNARAESERSAYEG